MIRILLTAIVFFLAGCASTLPPPQNRENINAIFKEYPKWYGAAKRTEVKWGVPVPVQMAIIYYESAFKGDARPPRRYLFGCIPWKHITSAYGYAQALDGTWEDYLAKEGSYFAARNKFECATDFIGWYSAKARQRLGIAPSDPYNLYLAYHEGLGGYERRSYLKKPWLMRLANKVAQKSQLFEGQFACLEGRSNLIYSPTQVLPDVTQIMPELEPPQFNLSASDDSEQNI